MRFGMKPQDAYLRIVWLARILAVLMLAAYVVIYWYEPFTESVNNFLSNFFSQIASLFAAVMATLIWGRYEPDDAPKRIWGNFSTGLWLWFAGEISWGYINLTSGEVSVGAPDVFWVISYFFLGQALLFQYKILNQPTARMLTSRVLLALVALAILLLLIFKFLGANTQQMVVLDTLVNAFYPAADILLAGIALWLARNFAGGAFARPWLGLLVFSFSDLLYAWLDFSGMYTWSVDQGNLLSTITDVSYFAAYLVLGLGVLAQWLFLKYGLRAASETR